MKVSYEWLKRYIALDRTPDEIEEALTLIGFEVEEVIEKGLPKLEHVVVGEILSREPHPNADRLGICQVQVDSAGTEKRIVCGATNYKVGDRVPVALPGAVLPGNFKIKKSKLRGEVSEGMMCSGKELGLSEDGAGLLILEQRPEPGTPLNEVYPDGDVIFDVEVTPNRPDCLSHVGIARELGAYFGLPLRYPEIGHNFESAETSEAGDLLRSVAVEAEDGCPHYTVHLIAGVKVGPSPDWLKRAIEAIGLRPINNVVDITNYVLHELGQPLHAFDVKKITGRKLIVRRAENGEKIVTLDEKERTLSERMLVIADEEKPLVVAGVMGSVDAEVDETTTDIALESAWFEPRSVRRTSRRLGLSTDSSYRFERGVDPFNLVFAAQRAADLILEIAGGHLAGPMIEVGGEPPVRSEIKISQRFIEQKAGFSIEEKRVSEIFRALELEARRRMDDEEGLYWTVQVPGFRSDLEAPIDLVEELIRIHGTDKIPASEVRAPGIIARDDPMFRYNSRAADYLVGQRFVECVNYTLRSADEMKTWFSEAGVMTLGLANPLSADQSHLRWSLIPGLLDNIQLNQARKTGANRFFEIGRVFRDCEGKVCELNAVAFCIVNDEKQTLWMRREPADFYHARSHVEALAAIAGFDLSRCDFGPVPGSNLSWQEGHSASVSNLAEGFEARMGLLSPFLLRERGIDGTVVAGVFTFLAHKLPEEKPRQFRRVSAYPAAERDLALVVPRDMPAEAVRRALAGVAEKAAGEKFSVESVVPFDVYEGKGLPEGKKSLAFALTFRAMDRTLTDDEVNQVFTAIQERVTEETGYAVRK